MKAGDVVAAEEVPSPALVRDGDGTFYHRRGSFGQVARSVGPWRVWGEIKRFHWFRRGLFEIVALDVREAVTAAELAELGAEHEAQFGVPEFGVGSIMVEAVEVPLCTFCGEPSRQSASVIGNAVQQVSVCNDKGCRFEFAKLTNPEMPHWGPVGPTKSKRRNRRPRQKTRLT